MSEKPTLNFPLCVNPVKEYIGKGKLSEQGTIIYETIEYECQNKKCLVNIQFDNLPLAEARARFMQRPESEKEKLLEQFYHLILEAKEITFPKNGIECFGIDEGEDELRRMFKNLVDKIEKELKG